MIMGDTDLCPFDMGTWGSMTTRFSARSGARLAAEARGVLLELASKQLKSRFPARPKPGGRLRLGRPGPEHDLRAADQGKANRAPPDGEAGTEGPG